MKKVFEDGEVENKCKKIQQTRILERAASTSAATTTTAAVGSTSKPFHVSGANTSGPLLLSVQVSAGGTSSSTGRPPSSSGKVSASPSPVPGDNGNSGSASGGAFEAIGALRRTNSAVAVVASSSSSSRALSASDDAHGSGAAVDVSGSGSSSSNSSSSSSSSSGGNEGKVCVRQQAQIINGKSRNNSVTSLYNRLAVDNGDGGGGVSAVAVSSISNECALVRRRALLTSSSRRRLSVAHILITKPHQLFRALCCGACERLRSAVTVDDWWSDAITTLFTRQ